MKIIKSPLLIFAVCAGCVSIKPSKIVLNVYPEEKLLPVETLSSLNYSFNYPLIVVTGKKEINAPMIYEKKLWFEDFITNPDVQDIGFTFPTSNKYLSPGKHYNISDLLEINSLNQLTEPKNNGKKLKIIYDNYGFIRIHSSSPEFQSAAKTLFWIVPSFVSLLTLNILGYPLYSASCKVATDISLFDSNKETIKTYSFYASGTAHSALYWGYPMNDRILNKAAEYKAIIKAIRDFNKNIVGDIHEINQKLTESGTMVDHFQDQLLQLEKYKAGHTTEGEFLNDLWTLDDKHIGITGRYKTNTNTHETIYELAYLRDERLSFVIKIFKDIEKISGGMTDNFRLKSDENNIYPICTLTFQDSLLKSVNYPEYLKSVNNDFPALYEVDHLHELDGVFYDYHQTQKKTSEDVHFDIYSEQKLISTFEFGSAKKSFPSHTCYFYINKYNKVILSKKPL